MDNAWRVQEPVGAGSWSHAGSVGNLDYYYLYMSVTLNDSARVDNMLRYEGRKTCLCVASANYNGPLMRMCLE